MIGILLMACTQPDTLTFVITSDQSAFMAPFTEKLNINKVTVSVDDNPKQARADGIVVSLIEDLDGLEEYEISGSENRWEIMVRTGWHCNMVQPIS